MPETIEIEAETETETTDATTDAPPPTEASPPTRRWPSLSAQLQRLQGYAERFDRAGEEAMGQGLDALESLSRLTRDNLAIGREVAESWRAAGVDVLRRQAQVFTPLRRR